MRLSILTLGLMALTPLLTRADEAPPTPPPPQGVWTGKGQAGYVSSKGNSQSKSANAALDMALLDGPWKHTFHLSGLYGQSAGIVSAERWETGWQSNYDLTEKLFTFGALRYQHDMFSGFQYQASATAGFGYKFVNTDATKLTGQVGAGYRRLRPEELTKDASGAIISRTLEPAKGGVIGTAAVDYSQHLTSTTTLTDKLLVESGSIDTLMSNTVALVVKVSNRLALSVAYAVQDNTKPPAGLKKVDTLETLNLVYSF